MTWYSTAPLQVVPAVQLAAMNTTKMLFTEALAASCVQKYCSVPRE